MSANKKWTSFLALLIMGNLLLSACAKTTPEIVEEVVTLAVEETAVVRATPQAVEEEATVIVEVATATPEPTPEGPTVGGTLVAVLYADPGTLDTHKTMGSAEAVMRFIGASLVTRDPDGKFVPYLAEEWEVSEDGLTWDFVLKQGVKFHDGTPLTAHEYAWTLQRVLDPKTQSPAARVMLGAVTSAEAVDDYTLRLTSSEPSPALLVSLTESGYLMPLSKAAVERWGDEYGRHPVSVGPYKFKEWVTGDRIVLERNPDYNWGPEYAHQGPWYFETIEFRVIPEYATVLAGLEAGEIDRAGLQAADVERVREGGEFRVYEPLYQGASPYVAMNVSQSPFDDVRVRQAFSLAVDQAALIEIAAAGHAVPQYGPLSRSVAGYWPGVEEIGYRYDLERAKALMAEAGYTVGADGVLEKDSQPLRLVLKTTPFEDWVRAAEALKEQYKALGVEIEIEELDTGAITRDALEGNYTLSLASYGWPDAAILWAFFHSSNVTLNYGHVGDPELDKILEKSIVTVNPGERQEWVNLAQKYIIEQAYMVPLYTPKDYVSLSSRVKGAVFSPVTSGLYLDDAYIESGQ